MATYEEIYGKRVKEFDSDPTLDSSYEGQVWYDKSSGTLRSLVAISAWVSSTPLPIATNQSGGAGVNTASLIFGGTSPANNAEDATYEYNGSGYSNGGNLNTSRTGISGAGTQTAALGAGGYLFPGGSNHTETYNGSSWTAATAMPTSDSYCSCGTQAAAIYVADGTTLEYSSPSWTAGGALNTPRSEASMAGTQTANIFFGGGPQTSASSASEEYDGTSFTNSATMNTARGIQIGGSGVQTSALAYGGAGPTEPGISTATESWNGTSWSTEGSLGTKASQVQKGGSTSADSTSGIAAGGFTPSRSSKTEEYSLSINTITAAAWASGGNVNTARGQSTGAGSQTAGLMFGGDLNPGSSAAAEEYDGSTWTNVTSLPGGFVDHQGTGTQTAGLSSSGTPAPGGYSTSSFEYDGSSWTAGGSVNLARGNMGGAGTQTSSLIFGGTRAALESPGHKTETEEYNGTSWSEVSDLPTAQFNQFGTGTSTAALSASGGPPMTTSSFEYDGSSWTAGGSVIQQRIDSRGGGTQTAAIMAGGYISPGSPTYRSEVEGYDGTSFFTQPSLATAVAGGGSGQGASTSAANWVASGNPTPTTATQEFTGETSVVTASTLTSS